MKRRSPFSIDSLLARESSPSSLSNEQHSKCGSCSCSSLSEPIRVSTETILTRVNQQHLRSNLCNQYDQKSATTIDFWRNDRSLPMSLFPPSLAPDAAPPRGASASVSRSQLPFACKLIPVCSQYFRTDSTGTRLLMPFLMLLVLHIIGANLMQR